MATLVAVIYAWINFRQREIYDIPDDGVAWLDTTAGAQAWKVTPNSPAARAGVRPDDVLTAIDDYSVHNQVQVTKRLFRAGLWTQVRYKLVR
ncbi:MAG TPA: PDZ domain-containing protein, partial [Candidatus Acidoferrum sp.]|nr:PDZ domain-containing protein [Candidatus Acidoferrum sp.]